MHAMTSDRSRRFSGRSGRWVHGLVGISLVACGVGPVRAAEEYETPPILQAAEFAPEGVPLRGARYAIDAELPTDGYLATYTIRSDFGTLQARGPGMLQVRIAEIDALSRLETMKKSEVFAESLKKSAGEIGDAVVNVVTNPVETARAIPAGVGRFFDRAVRQTKTGLQKLDDVRQDREPGAPRNAGGLSDASPDDAPTTAGRNLAAATGVAAGRAARDVLGYDEKRRELARELGVDPYTTNPVLKKGLDDIAWAAFAGGLGVNMAASAIPGSMIVRSASIVNDWVYEKPPGDLMVWIETTLRQMGTDQETIDLFLRHKAFTLTTQTALVRALEALGGVDGRAKVIETAVTAENEDQARFLAAGLSLLAREHRERPLAEILDGRPIGRTRDGRVLVTAPVDYVSWTERAATFAPRDDLLSHRPLLLVTGRLSERTRSEMERLGWEIREGVTLEGAF